MPKSTPKDPSPGTPRTDLPPEREPYYEGYFGTEEEEGVEREEESREGEKGREAGRDASGHGDDDERGASRDVKEDAAGGDREIS